MARNRADGSLIFDTRVDSNGFNRGLRNITGSIGSLRSMLGGLASAISIAFSITAVVNFGKTCINTAIEVENAWVGLNSIINGQGKSFDNAKKFIQEYISDGLVPLKNAVTAYKNLSIRGYTDEQIKSVMIAFKNSATYARQSQYTLGDAISTATEGLKNENSIVVDNAGVTKNVAKMWEDYAKSIGVTYNSLTKQQKIEAEVAGILEETKYQMGDATRYASTYSGQLARLNAIFTNFKTKIGNILKVIASRFLPLIITAISGLERLVDKTTSWLNSMGIQTDVVSTLTDVSNSADTLTDSIETTTEANEKLKNSLAGFDKLNVLSQAEDKDTGSASLPNTNLSLPANTSISTAETEKSVNGLTKVFDRFKKSLDPFAEKVGEGLSWFTDNVLIPLGAWTINDVVPAFLDILSGALDVLTSVIDMAQPYFEWLWNNFLQPIAEWTGGVIVSFLQGIGSALKAIADVPEAIIIIESLIAGLAVWKIGCIVAANATKLLAAEQAILNAVMNANPIGILITILGGLIAAVILLWNNCDWFREFWINAWNDICEVAKNVWNNICEVAKNVWESITTFFVSAWEYIEDVLFNGDVVQFFSNIWLEIKNAFSPVVSWFKDTFTKAWEAVKNVFSAGGRIFEGIKDGISSVFKNVVNGLIDGINFVIAIPFNAINTALQTIKNIDIAGIKPFEWIGTIDVPQIPKLATGTVVPANYGEFMAVLGDNKREPEVVSPLSTMKQAMREVLAEMNVTQNNNGEIVVVLELDGEVLFKKNVQLNNKYKKRHGGKSAFA